MPRLHSGAATDRVENNITKFPPIPEVVWLQPLQTNLVNNHNDSITGTHVNTHTPQVTQGNDVEKETSTTTRTSPQKSRSDSELFLRNQTRTTPVTCLNSS